METVKELERTKKELKKYHMPELRLHGKVTDVTRDGSDDPYNFSDGIECYS